VRIAFLADAPYVHTRRWIQYFVAAGYDCQVVTFRPAEIAGASVHYVSGAEPLGKARYLINARKVRGLLRELRPDLVHAMHLTSYGFLGALANVKPLIVSVWGTDVLEAPNLTPFHRWLTRYALQRADLITATGLHLATETTRYTPPQMPVTVVPYGVDLGVFSPAETPRADDGRVVIGTVARLSPEKGLPYLLDAFATLRRRLGRRVVLRVAGDGPERSRLEAQIVRLGLSGAVKMFGWVEHEALPAFLRGLDVFAVPSTWEGFGVAAAEASACGLPIVSTDVHGLPDVVRHNVTGLLVPSKDANALAAALESLIDDPERRSNLGDAGRAYVAEHYDWNANAAQMETIYKNVLASKTRAPVGATS
jgi:glycosyltransferase involved in cell wall biosynthesis